MRYKHLCQMLPERAFQKKLGANAPATLEGGGGGIPILSCISNAICSAAQAIGSAACSVGSAVGGVICNMVQNPIQTIADVAAVATGNPELVPLINTGNALANGASVCQALESGAISAATAGIGAGVSCLIGGIGACVPVCTGSGITSGAVCTALQSGLTCAPSGLTSGTICSALQENLSCVPVHCYSTPYTPTACAPLCAPSGLTSGTICSALQENLSCVPVHCYSTPYTPTACAPLCGSRCLAANTASALGSRIAGGTVGALVNSALRSTGVLGSSSNSGAGATAGATGSSGTSSTGASCSAGSGALGSGAATCASKQGVSPLAAHSLAGAPVYASNQAKLAQLKQLYPQLGGTGSTSETGLSASPVQSLQQTTAQEASIPQSAAASNPYSSLYQTLFESPVSQAAIPVAAKGGGTSDIVDRFEKKNPPLPQYAKDGHVPEFVTGATGHYVKGKGDGQSDDIPAMLADGEYVFDADTVAALGNGSSDAGAKVLDKMRENLRKHKRSASPKEIPPKAKSPLEYLKGK